MTTVKLLILACAIVLTSHAEATQREQVCLNGIWMIHNGGASDTIPVDTWTAVRVPNKQSGWYLEESDIALGVMEGTTAWYRTGFEIPADWNDGRRIMLLFEGVNHYARVFVNGTAIGHHRFVCDAFELDITNVARPGEVNDLAVYVADVMAPAMADDFIEQLKWRAYVLRNGGLIDNVFLCSYPDVRVADVFIGVVVGPPDGRDAALGVAGVGLAELALRDQDHRAMLGGLQSEEQPGDAGAHDQEVALGGHDRPSILWSRRDRMPECAC